MDIKAIIGLGNPGKKYYKTRHSVGFRIVDALAEKFGLQWKAKEDFEFCEFILDDKKILLVKPMTFMNNSGRAMSFVVKKGISPEEILVIHDELEFPLGKIRERLGGSARGHNGLKSIISVIGENFHRIRFGIDRPEEKNLVSDYVLQNFNEEPITLIYEAVNFILTFLDKVN